MYTQNSKWYGRDPRIEKSERPEVSRVDVIQKVSKTVSYL